MENIIFSEGRGRPLSNMEGTSVQTHFVAFAC